jgi:glutathione S-transferase
MADRLFIGNKRFSSWSLRGWLPVRIAGLAVEEVVIPLHGGITPEVKRISPAGTVPLLEHDGNRVWESLAICEYCAELHPALWPAERGARAHARAIAAEMHAGFAALRQAMSMDVVRTDLAGQGRTDRALADIARIEAIWRETRQRFGAGGQYLFGAAFGAADAMYAPVVARLITYRPVLTAESEEYCQAVRAHPLVQEWYDGAAAEPAEWGKLHG